MPGFLLGGSLLASAAAPANAVPRMPLQQTGLLDRVVAVVDGAPITLSEVEEAVALDPASAAFPDLRGAVENLIAARLMEREARRYPADPPTPDEAEATFRALMERFGTMDGYRDTLLRLGIREDYLRRRIERELVVDRYLERRFRPLVQVSQQQVQEYYREVLLPDLPPGAPPPLERVEDSIRRILEERDLNRRISAWVDELKGAAEIVRLPLPGESR